MLSTRIILLLAFFAFLPSLVFAQNKTDQKEAIRKAFQQINNDQRLKKLTLESEAFLKHMPDGGGELTGFYKDGQLVKIREWIGLSDGNKVVEYYLKDGALIFVYGQFNTWMFDATLDEFDHSKTKTIFEGRYYFHQQKLIDKIEKGNMHTADEMYYKENNMLTTANQYATLLNKTKK
ncbi:PulJ/GspJ family protein [Flavisolibacter tropicus]|uniref:PulJ/GspJ family protein n=1 Tax=Flavisolibacter tropicus TaxID=1492898 RepID=UPI0011DF074F|nr:hypothetical protein [Flavisolibacter tropicus]